MKTRHSAQKNRRLRLHREKMRRIRQYPFIFSFASPFDENGHIRVLVAGRSADILRQHIRVGASARTSISGFVDLTTGKTGDWQIEPVNWKG